MTGSPAETRSILMPANSIHRETLKTAVSEEVNATKNIKSKITNYLSPQLQIATKSNFPHAEVDALFGL